MVNSNVYVSLAFRVVHEIGDGALGALLTLFISRLFEKRSDRRERGPRLGPFQILGQMAGRLIFSPLGYRYGLQYPFLICGGPSSSTPLWGRRSSAGSNIEWAE